MKRLSYDELETGKAIVRPFVGPVLRVHKIPFPPPLD